jgi:hypothetical protein
MWWICTLQIFELSWSKSEAVRAHDVSLSAHALGWVSACGPPLMPLALSGSQGWNRQSPRSIRSCSIQARRGGCPPQRSCVRRRRRPPAAVDNPGSRYPASCDPVDSRDPCFTEPGRAVRSRRQPWLLACFPETSAFVFLSREVLSIAIHLKS